MQRTKEELEEEREEEEEEEEEEQEMDAVLLTKPPSARRTATAARRRRTRGAGFARGNAKSVEDRVNNAEIPMSRYLLRVQKNAAVGRHRVRVEEVSKDAVVLARATSVLMRADAFIKQYDGRLPVARPYGNKSDEYVTLTNPRVPNGTFGEEILNFIQVLRSSNMFIGGVTMKSPVTNQYLDRLEKILNVEDGSTKEVKVLLARTLAQMKRDYEKGDVIVIDAKYMHK